MGDRKDYIEQLKTDTVNAGSSYHDLRRQIRSQEAAVRKAASKASRERETAGSQEAEKIIAEVLEQIAAMRKQAEAEVVRQAAEAKSQLKGEADHLALAIMEKLLERRVSQ